MKSANHESWNGSGVIIDFSSISHLMENYYFDMRDFSFSQCNGLSDCISD